MKAYKVFNSEWKCNGYDFKIDGSAIGTEHKHNGILVLCSSGFHFCRKLVNCFNYYEFNPKNKVAEIDVIGDVIGTPSDKECTNHFIILREITWHEVIMLVNSGNGNSGYKNSGDRNSGDGNSGDGNSGDKNSGNGNSGYKNSGNGNSGYKNSGDKNSGNGNSGNGNSGDKNSGNGNSGYRNSGDGNSGDGNSGNGNSGDGNSGNKNSGNGNSGYRNSGNKNSGNGNSGYRNSGDGNSGDFNSCNYSSGIFCNKNEYLIIFNKYSKFSDKSEFYNKFNFLNRFKLYYCRKLKKYLSYKESWKLFYGSLSKNEKNKILEIPNFNKEIFFEITGIDVTKKVKLP